MRTAIVHYWLLNRRGGEKVVEAICRLLPGADIFTLFYEPESVGPEIRSRRVTASFLNPLRRYHRHLLPLMPIALESLDLRGYDLVVSSESGPAKGVLLPSSARHVCYCHTPMRYLWELYPAYLNDWSKPGWRRVATAALTSRLRLWDYASAARVDDFVANSDNVRRRIWKTYRRDARVIYPPVAVESFYRKPAEEFYLTVSELVPYKRVDVAVRVFSATRRQLRVVGRGPELRRLRKIAGPTVEFCGRVSDSELRELYATCRALVIPAEEDFGMTAVEALASGKPVIALARGGVLESVPTREPSGGVFYVSDTDEGLAAAVAKYELLEPGFASRELQSYAARFSTAVFEQRMSEVLGLDVPGAARPGYACAPARPRSFR